MLANPAFRERFLIAQSLEPGGESGAAFGEVIRTDLARWGGDAVRASGIKPE